MWLPDDRPDGLGMVEGGLRLPSMQEHVVARIKYGICGCHAHWLWPRFDWVHTCSNCGLKVRWVDVDGTQ